MGYDDNRIHPIFVKAVDPSDMSAFGVTVKQYDDDPTYYVSNGIVWLSACWVWIYDDGRVYVSIMSKLLPWQLRVVYGITEEAFEGGLRKARYERWTRLRPTKKRKVGRYRMHYYVRADSTDPHAKVMLAAQCEHDPDGINADAVTSIEQEQNAGSLSTSGG